MHKIAKQLNVVRDQLRASFVEREDAIEAALLALLSGEHICFLGDPGTGKSMMVRHLVGALDSASYFEVLLSKTRPAERILGPLDIKEFRETGNYFLKRKGFATDVDIVMLDEIGKMSAVTGHDLLALLNERVYHEVNGGRSVHPAPLHTAFTASNEIPTNESDDAEAMWDRILFRVLVKDIADNRSFAHVLTAPVPEPTAKVDFAGLKRVTATDVATMPVGEDALMAIVQLRTILAEDGVEASVRRWRASMKAVRAAAFLDGATRVEQAHLAALRFTLWDDLEERPKVERRVLSASNPFYDDLEKWTRLTGEIEIALRTRKDDTTSLATYATEATVKLQAVRDGLDQIIMTAGGKNGVRDEVRGLREAADKHRAVMIRVFTECHGMSPDTAIVAAEKKLGLGGGTVTKAMR